MQADARTQHRARSFSDSTFEDEYQMRQLRERRHRSQDNRSITIAIP